MVQRIAWLRSPGSLMRGALCTAAVLSGLLASGCGDSDDDFYDVSASSTVSLTTSTSVSAPPGTVIYNTAVAGARLITGDQLRFSGFDASLEPVYGPITVAGAGLQRLQSVPASVRTLQVESLREGRRVSVRSFEINFDATATVTVP